ncbi:MAG: hypothetical protein LH628_21740 [Microcoleus sp. CAN_BIN18]|nr:hypothetical protein [Microcoleus sp. CAN_BIN18]
MRDLELAQKQTTFFMGRDRTIPIASPAPPRPPKMLLRASVAAHFFLNLDRFHQSNERHHIICVVPQA